MTQTTNPPEIATSENCFDCREIQERLQNDEYFCEFHTCKSCLGDNSDSETDICEACQEPMNPNTPPELEICNQVILGDCLEKMKDIPDNSIDMILTDLPYGVTARNKWDVVIPMDKLWSEWNRIKKETTPIVLTAIQPFTSLCVMSNPELFKYEWIWEKQQGTGFLNAKKQPLRNHEQILIFYEKQSCYNPQMSNGVPYTCKSGKGSQNYDKQIQVVTENKGERYPLTVQNFKYDGKKEHPTQKPIKLFDYLIKTYTNEGDLVLDCCAGSGTTAIACMNTNRNYICIEKEPKYFEIMKKRIADNSQKITGFVT